MPRRLAQHLMTQGLLPAATVDEVLRKLDRDSVGIDTLFLEEGTISEAGMLQALSDVSGYRHVNLADFEPNEQAAALLPLRIAQRLKVAPLSVEDKTLHLAVPYPVPAKQLKEVEFLIGKQLELWVGLECRIRDWMSWQYHQPLDVRFTRLLSALDPTRKAVAEAVEDPDAESLSDEVMDRISKGYVEEPVLLVKRKGPGAQGETLGVMNVPNTREHTVIIDTHAYQAFARGKSDGGVKIEDDSDSNTAVLDISTYEAFAREISKHDVTQDRRAPGNKPAAVPPTEPEAWAVPPSNARLEGPVGVYFPGGVLPPARPRSVEENRSAKKTFSSQPSLWVTPAPAARPSTERPRRPELPLALPSQRAVDTTPPLPPTPAPNALPPIPDNELDFSDVAPKPSGPGAPPPPLPRYRTPMLTGPESPREVAPITAPEPSAPQPFAAASVPATPSAPVPQARPSFPDPVPPRATPTAPGTSPPSSSAPPAPRPSVPPAMQGYAQDWTLAQARAALKASSLERDKLIHTILLYGRRTFEFVGFFAVSKGAAQGFEAMGEGELPAMRQVSIPLDAASVFRTVALTRGSYVGPLPPDTLSKQYLQLMGRSPRTVLVSPVEVKSKLVAIIYGDCGQRPVSQRKLSDFILFCQDIPAAFNELILKRRQENKGPPISAPVVAPLPKMSPPTRPTDPEWFNGLLAMLTGPEAGARRQAMEWLERTPAASARALAQHFPGPSAWTRLPVDELPEAEELGPIAGALARLGRYGAQALAPLLDTEDSDTRYLALLAAGSMPFPELVDGVLRGVFDYEPDISSAARATATKLKDLPEFELKIPPLRQELASKDPLRRSLAARALGVLHDRQSIDGLIGLTGSDDELCAQSAAEALREMTCASYGVDPRAWTVWWAGAKHRRRVEWLVDALESDDFDSRLRAIEELTAFFHDNLGYSAEGTPAERQASALRWKSLLQNRSDVEV